MYLDDRSNANALIRSYYDAISRQQYLRAYSYWETSDSLPSFDTFAQGFAGTTDVQVELGTVGGSAGAGQLYWSVPAAVFSTTTAGAQSFVGCYTAHLARPELQAAPPFKPMGIQAGQLSAVATPAAARAALSTACGTANATLLPWGDSSAGVDATNYVDDRSAGDAVIRSYYNAVNRKEYTRAYSYWESGASLSGRHAAPVLLARIVERVTLREQTENARSVALGRRAGMWFPCHVGHGFIMDGT